jgi:predicted ester cyclase
VPRAAAAYGEDISQVRESTTSMTSSVTDSKAVVRRFMDECLNAHDVSIARQVVTGDHVAHFAGIPQALDLQAWLQIGQGYFDAFPDFHLTVQDLVAEGDRVAVRCTWTGTHQGEFMGAPATGKHVEGAGMGLYRVAGSLIAEQWVTEDMTALMRQLSQDQGGQR